MPQPADSVTLAARFFSIAGHPFVALPAAVYVTSLMNDGDSGSGLRLLVLFGVVAVVIVIGIRTGRFNNFDVSERDRRPRFYALLTSAVFVFGFWQRDQPQAFRACMVAGALLLVCGVANRWVKVSLHSAFAMYAAGLVAASSAVAALVTLPVCAAIAWSRVHLGRHRRSEVWLGLALGLVAGASLSLWPLFS